MSDIDQLLQVDTDNILVTKKFYREYSPQLFEALEEATQLFKTFARAYGQEALDHDDVRLVNERGLQLGAPDGETLFSMLYAPLPNDPERAQIVRDGKAAVDRIRARRVRGFLLTLTDRSYMFAVTDLLRLRITSALGSLRVQIEAVALMTIMQKNPAVALDWLEIHNDEAGRKFFTKHRQSITDFSKRYDLMQAWNMASGSAQHARFASIVQGLSLQSSSKGHKRVDEYKLIFQESSNEPAYLILYTLYILRTQQRLFLALLEALPEITDPLLMNTRIPAFGLKIDKLWGHIGEAYSEYVARWRRRGAESKGDES
jgi:hypothetical protein